MHKKILLFLSLFSLVAVLNLSAQDFTYIYSTQFDGGMDGWTSQPGTKTIYDGNTPVGSEADPDVIFTWTADGTASQGSFWEGQRPINSPTASNGAVMFNSDFIDNGGDPSMLFTVNPAPHYAELISPSFSCASNSSVWVRFHQNFRHFDAVTAVGVSVDGGATWKLDTINEDVWINEGSGSSAIEMVDFTNEAAGQANVIIKFVFSGDYYFWIIDDVDVIEQPKYNVSINSTFRPFIYAQPAELMTTDSSTFSAQIENKGSDTIIDAMLLLNVQDGDGNILYEDSLVVDPLAPGEKDSLQLPGIYAPGLLTENQEHFYVYRLVTNMPEANPWDNIVVGEFVPTSNLYSADDLTTSFFIFPPPGDKTIGNFYRTSTDIPEGTTFCATEATFQAAANSGALTGNSVTIYLLKLTAGLQSFFHPAFDITQDIGNENQILKIVGLATHEFTDEGNFDDITVSLSDFNTFEPGVELDPGATYMLAARYLDASATNVSHAVSTKFDYGVDELRASSLSSFAFFPGGGGTRWYPLGFYALLRMTVEKKVSTSVDEVELPSDVMKIYPNPTSSDLFIDLSFEDLTNASLMIADINGKILQLEELKSVQNLNKSFNIKDYAAGTYLIRVATKEGTRTKRFVKQ